MSLLGEILLVVVAIDISTELTKIRKHLEK